MVDEGEANHDSEEGKLMVSECRMTAGNRGQLKKLNFQGKINRHYYVYWCDLVDTICHLPPPTCTAAPIDIDDANTVTTPRISHPSVHTRITCT